MTGALKFHPNEPEVNTALVYKLLAAHAPRWKDWDVRPVGSIGKSHSLFRLGDALVVRLPRTAKAATELAKEAQWLPQLKPIADSVDIAIPNQVLQAPADPDLGYPFAWAMYEWIDGAPLDQSVVRHRMHAAEDLAEFVKALSRSAVDVSIVASLPGERGMPLVGRDVATRSAIECLRGPFLSDDEADRALAVWDDALSLPNWSGPAKLFHGDLLPSNILTLDGNLHAVIDFGLLGAGDPAVDMLAAWNAFDDKERRIFRETCDVDSDTWWRGRALALSQAAIYIPYYAQTDPRGCRTARLVITEVLMDSARE
jgi:aminoglycoside phosphotransferase (APT) family kinase protein